MVLFGLVRMISILSYKRETLIKHSRIKGDYYDLVVLDNLDPVKVEELMKSTPAT